MSTHHHPLALRGIQRADGTITEFFFAREDQWGDSEVVTPLPAPELEQEEVREADGDSSCPF